MGRLALAAFLLLCVLLGCARENKGKDTLPAASGMNAPEYAIGVPQGAAAMVAVEQSFPRCRIKYFDSVHDGYLAVKHRKIDAFAFDRPTLQYVTIHNPDLAVMDEKIADEQIVVGSALGRDDLIRKVNAFIRQYKSDGTYRDMYSRWILNRDAKMPDLPEPKNPAMTLRIGTDGLSEPMNFYSAGELTGFDIEFSKRLALFLNAKIEYQIIPFPAIVAAAISGKIDLLIANLNATPERRKKMLFSDNYFDSEVALLVRKDRLPPKPDGAAIADIPQLAGKKVGILTGSYYDALLKQHAPEALHEYFSSFTDQVAAVKAGKISAFVVDEPIAREIANSTSGVTVLKEMLCRENYAFAFSKKRPDLQQRVSAALKEMHDSGAIRKLDTKWFAKDESARVLPELRLDGKNGVIRFGTDSNTPPFVYIKNGRMVGYDIEIAMTIAHKLGYRLELASMDFAALIPALVSDKIDMAGACITATEERAKSVLFSVPNYHGGVVIMVASGDGDRNAGRAWSALAGSFQRTFVIENRYKLVLQGLWVTVIITISSAVLGTLLGFGVCMMRRSGTRWANVPAKIFIRAVQGTPIVVLLMILYYIVFGSVDINGILVAVIGFSINFAAYVSEMMRTGIESVDKGQQEAAAAIGFSRLQVFARIIFPQAARHVLPVFKGEFISMLKMTSVVGYIAIQDLTRMSDIIRSRTYEAFFPLIATALIYFAVAWTLTSLLSIIEIRIDPKRRKRVVKGAMQP